MKKENCAVFPGSFDPITLGHKDVICRAIPLFDKIYVAIGDNIDKKYMFPIEKRLEWLQIAFKNFPSIEVAKFDGLTIDFCNKHNINFILRGLRTSADFEFERQIAQINK
ncbi:MAG TPA: pantetheine-phosphate adenylyltransferase, partial [Bacteroidales bacterium]|nr:pantetheine-phosphate adenylyltransferase [Bacteroidales bacterium]